MTDLTGGSGESPHLSRLVPLAAAFLDAERDLRVAVLDAVDAGHTLTEIASVTRVPTQVLDDWSGNEPVQVQDLDDVAATSALDELRERRQLRTASPAERVAARETRREERDATHGSDDA